MTFGDFGAVCTTIGWRIFDDEYDLRKTDYLPEDIQDLRKSMRRVCFSCLVVGSCIRSCLESEFFYRRARWQGKGLATFVAGLSGIERERFYASCRDHKFDRERVELEWKSLVLGLVKKECA